MSALADVTYPVTCLSWCQPPSLRAHVTGASCWTFESRLWQLRYPPAGILLRAELRSGVLEAGLLLAMAEPCTTLMAQQQSRAASHHMASSSSIPFVAQPMKTTHLSHQLSPKLRTSKCTLGTSRRRLPPRVGHLAATASTVGSVTSPEQSILRRFIHGWTTQNLRQDIFGGITAAVVAVPLALAFGVASGTACCPPGP